MSVPRPSACEPFRGDAVGDGFRGGLVDVAGDDPRAGLGEFLRVDLADALAAAGHDDGAAGEIEARVGGHAD